MTHKNWKSIFAVAFMCLLLALPAIAEGPARLADVTFQTDAIVLQPQAAAKAFTFRVTGPGDFVFDGTFGAGETIHFGIFDAAGNLLPDGLYKFELTAVARQNKAATEVSLRGLEKVQAERRVQDGSFRILNGAVVDPAAAEKPSADAGLELKVAPGATLETKDQVFADDLIVIGSACVGQDCANGESFGFDTLRLKENNLRIKFQDTSTGSFPSNDWQLTANDSANGGLNRFSIDDIDGGKTPFTIEAGAPSNSLYVESSGEVGLGTSEPVVQLHIKDGNTPTLRLEQDGSSGFTAQTWDLAGNEANFFIRDVTNGSQLPFRIEPGADTNALFIDDVNNIGIGTNSPSEDMHMRRTDAAQTFFKIENTNATAQFAGVSMINNATANAWDMSVNPSGQFRISLQNSGVVELLVDDATGDVTIERDLTVNGAFMNPSSRTLKTGFEPVDRAEILERLAALPINKWTYTADATGRRHIGPFTEDFRDAFGLGTKGKNIIPLDVQGVTIAALQGLYETVQSKDAQIQDLEQRLAALEALLAQQASASE